MKKPELVKKIQEALNLRSQKEASDVLEGVTKVLIEALKAGEEVTLSDFGKFKSVTRAARECRNPKTGEAVKVPECTTVKFKPSDKMKSSSAE